jgi:hypothetical protein
MRIFGLHITRTDPDQAAAEAFDLGVRAGQHLPAALAGYILGDPAPHTLNPHPLGFPNPEVTP